MPARIALISIILLAAAAPGQGQDAPPSFATTRPDVKSSEPVLAFNGKDLTGFYVYTRDHGYEDPKRVFTVRGGLLHVSGEEYGGVATCGNFGNYHLMDYELMGGDARAAIIAEDAKRDMKPFLPPPVPFGSKQWPTLVTPGPGPASIADLH